MNVIEVGYGNRAVGTFAHKGRYSVLKVSQCCLPTIAIFTEQMRDEEDRRDTKENAKTLNMPTSSLHPT